MSGRAGWQRPIPPLTLTRPEIAENLALAVPGARLQSVAALDSGLSNTNLHLTFDRPPHQAVLRLFQQGLASASKEAALAALLQGKVPRAGFLYFAETAPQPWALLEFVAGRRLDRWLAGADAARLAETGRAVGETLAALHAIPFPHPGFFGAALTLGPALDFGRDGLVAYLEQTVAQGRAGPRLGPALSDRLLAFARAEGGRLEDWMARPCLVHADFNPTNILLDHAHGGLRVAAVLDWEFALSAFPPFDFGNLLRRPLGTLPAFVQALEDSYRNAGGNLPRDWQRIAAIGDLFAWADMLSRPELDAARCEDGKAEIAATLGVRC